MAHEGGGHRHEHGSQQHTGQGHTHDHGAVLRRAGVRHRSRLLIAFGLVGGFFVVEAVAGLWTNSLALISDAGHMFTDVLGLGMALAAIQLATRFETRRPNASSPVVDTSPHSHTFGLYRLEILAAFVNALLLAAVAIWVVIEAVRRLFGTPEVAGGAMLTVAVGGLIVNLIAFFLLRSGAGESLNVQGAYLEVVADTVGSAGVIVAALAMQWFGWAWADPVVAVAIGAWILPRTLRLGRQAVRILLQAAPPHIDLGHLQRELHAIDGVVDVHDLHVWTLTSEMEAVSAHLMTSDGTDAHAVLDRARQLLVDEYGIHHGTFQVEPDSHEGCKELAW
ncbi:MAG: cation diffusion facilitator family transporter [Acidimicrobiales bacterium]